MSTDSINISPSNVSGKCDLKCVFNFNYPISNTTVRNDELLLTFTYENGEPPVTYNNVQYNVSSILLLSPSVHLFNGVQLNAELMIAHTPTTGGEQLYVCIPIISSSNITPAGNLINNLINLAATNAPAANDSASLSINDFTLEVIVPQKPFFSYAAGEYVIGNFIVFGSSQAIPVNSDTLSQLSEIIQPYPLPMVGNELFFNSVGPNATSTNNDDIYISCQPTGNSEENTAVEYNKNAITLNILSNPLIKQFIQIMVGGVIFIVLFFIIQKLLFLSGKGLSFNAIPNLHKMMTSINHVIPTAVALPVPSAPAKT